MEKKVPRKKKTITKNDPFDRQDNFVNEDGKTIARGDVIKIKGVWGTKFRFFNYVTNPKNGVSWIDCVELEKGVGCGMRSFYPDRVKAMPKKRGKRVKRSSKAS
jgi:hypothetical protein